MTTTGQMFRTVPEMLKAPLDELCHEERLRLLTALLDGHLVKQLLLEDLAPDAVVLSFAEDGVRPGEVRPCSARSFEAFRPSRLCVLETECEITDERSDETVTQGGFWFWRRTRREVRAKRDTYFVSVSPGAWSLRQMYLGCKNALPLVVDGTAGMGMASLELPEAARSEVITPGIVSMLAVSHNLQRPVPFRALLLGHLVR